MITCCPSSVCVSTPLNDFSSEIPGPIFSKLHVEPSGKGGLKSYTNCYGPLIKMAAMSIYDKTLKTLLFQNQETFKAESWYITSRTQGLPGLYEWWPQVDRWPFFRQGPIWVSMHLYGENIEKSFFQNVFKTNGWNLQCVIKVVEHFSYKTFCPLRVIFPCPLALYMHKIVKFVNVFF